MIRFICYRSTFAKFILISIYSCFFGLPVVTAYMMQPRIIVVAAGGDVQAAFNSAQPGDTIIPEAGAVFIGNFVLPVKTGDAFITIRSSKCDQIPVGTRISPSQSSLMATLATPNVGPVLRAPVFSHHYRFQCIQFTQGAELPTDQTAGYAWSYNLVQLGGGGSGEAQTTIESAPHHLAFDHVIVRPRDGGMTQRGITVNSASTSITNSYVADIKWPGVETHAIGGWNGPGPFLIENNYLEAASIPILFGGAATLIPNLVPSDITITRNTMTKRSEWLGKGYVVKNLFELKNARRVTFTDNDCRYSWPDGQTGWAVILNAFHDSPQNVVDDVEIGRNVFRDVANGINIRGMDDGDTAARTHRIRIHDNLFDNIGAFNGEGKAFQVLNGSMSVHLDHNTVRGRVSADLLLVTFPNATNEDLRFTNNLMPHGDYGIFGDGGYFGAAALDKYASGWTVAGNALYAKPTDPAASLYPDGNYFPATESEASLLLGTDGLTVGAHMDAVSSPSPSPTPSASPTPVPSPVSSPTPKPSPTATPTVSPSPSPSPSPTPGGKRCKLWPPNKWFSCL